MTLVLHFKVKRLKRPTLKNAIDVQCYATSSTGSDTNVFVIQILPKNALNQSQFRFSHVADPVDMQDYPSIVDFDTPYFRTDSIKLRLRNQYQANIVIQTLKKQVRSLVNAINSLDSSNYDQFDYPIGQDTPQQSDSSSSSQPSQPQVSDSQSYAVLQGVCFQTVQLIEQEQSQSFAQHQEVHIDFCNLQL